jgi:hypothetical protein
MHPNIVGFSTGYHEISTNVTNLRKLPKISTHKAVKLILLESAPDGRGNNMSYNNTNNVR